MMSDFDVKDSGQRMQFDSGMVRDTADGKIDYWRGLIGPMFKRLCIHLTKGAVKYPDVRPGTPNWTLAAGDGEEQRYLESAVRHFIQWFNGDTDEDHAAAVLFNINGYEYVKERLAADAWDRAVEADKQRVAERFKYVAPMTATEIRRRMEAAQRAMVQFNEGSVSPLLTPEAVLAKVKTAERRDAPPELDAPVLEPGAKAGSGCAFCDSLIEQGKMSKGEKAEVHPPTAEEKADLFRPNFEVEGPAKQAEIKHVPPPHHYPSHPWLQRS
jgi:hypothetical protein